LEGKVREEILHSALLNPTSLLKKPETINLGKGKVKIKKPSFINLKARPIKSTLL
jgi:hypothetical protein